MNNLTRRLELSLRDWGPAPPWFKHAPTPGKPAAPPVPTYLVDADTGLFLTWFNLRDNGFVDPKKFANASPAVLQAIADFEASYFNGSDYRAWAHLDIASRDSQWRLFRADTHSQIEDPSSIVRPISADATGTGKNTSSASVVNVGNPSGVTISKDSNIDISAALGQTISDGYTPVAGQTFFITDYDVSFYVPVGSSIVPYLVEIGAKSGGVTIYLWNKYAPMVAAAGQTISMSAQLITPIRIAGGATTEVRFTNLINTASTGAKAAYSLNGYYT